MSGVAPMGHAAFLSGPSRTDTIFTIGYEGLVQTQLLELLSAAGVSTVLDVRAVAASRKAGFSKTVLSASVSACGMRYLHEVSLGTPKAGRDAVRRGQVPKMVTIFEAHMQTPSAQAGLARVVELARAGAVCLLCFERMPHDCHRAILAAMIRARTDQRIRHL